MVEASTFAPQYEIEVNDEPLNDKIKRFISHVEYESVDGMADLSRIRMANPDSLISNSKVFQPGNELSFFMGYEKGNLKHIGRTKIIRQVLNFPQDDEPTLQVIGYTRDYEMMDNEPEGSVNRTWAVTEFSNVLDIVAGRYNFKKDIDKDEAIERNIIQKTGTSDYEFVKEIANLSGFIFWVDGDKNGDWVLHYKEPKKCYDNLFFEEGLMTQKKKYTFKYDFLNEGNLLSFTPELLIKGAKTKIAVAAKDVETGKQMYIELPEIDLNTPEMNATGDQNGEIKAEFKTANSIKLYFKNYAFEVITGKKFENEADMQLWAEQWFRRMRESFILSRGRLVGNGNIMARQVHKIEGIGPGYDGDYYFSKVKHVIGGSSGYIIDFGARKLV